MSSVSATTIGSFSSSISSNKLEIKLAVVSIDLGMSLYAAALRIFSTSFLLSMIKVEFKLRDSAFTTARAVFWEHEGESILIALPTLTNETERVKNVRFDIEGYR